MFLVYFLSHGSALTSLSYCTRTAFLNNFSNNCNNAYMDNVSPILSKFNDNLSLISINVRSLSGKSTELLTLIDSFHSSFYFICLTEVCLDDSSYVGFSIPKYNAFTCFRNVNGGGIIVYVREDVKANVIDEKSGMFPSHESLLLHCEINGFGDLYLWSLYRPPSRSVNDFLTYLEYTLPDFHSKKMCLTGDFNINLLNAQNNSVRRFCNLMASFDLRCCIDKPTFMCNTKKEPTSCLDHFWVNVRRSTESFILYPPFSDHMATILCFTNVISSQSQTITFRNFRKANKDNFLANLPLECNQFGILSDNVNVEVDRFIDWFTNLTNKYFPLKRKTVSPKGTCAPWLTARIKKCIAKKTQMVQIIKSKTYYL